VATVAETGLLEMEAMGGVEAQLVTHNHDVDGAFVEAVRLRVRNYLIHIL
jgi:hypothetical protein